MTLYDVPTNELIIKVAEELKKMSDITPPSWADFVKTGMHKERPPIQSDWWHIRAAAVLRTLQLKGPIGVSKLRVKYGGKKNRGMQPEKFFKASGNILRKILQQLEKAGLAKKAEQGVHKGRIITEKGASLIGKAANALMTEKKIVIPKKSTEELPVEYPKKKKKKKKTTKKKTKRKKATRKRAKKAVKKEESKEEAPKEAETPKEEKQEEPKVEE